MGDRVRRVVPAADVPAGGRVCDCVREPCEERDRETGWSGGPDLGWPAEAAEGAQGVEGAAAGRVHQATEGRVIAEDEEAGRGGGGSTVDDRSWG